MTKRCLFIESSDVWLFRDGRPFGVDDRELAVSLFPPTPRTIQGAIRSARLAQKGEPFDWQQWSDELTEEIGSPDTFGKLRVRGPLLAKWDKGRLCRYFPLPLDMEKWGGKWQALPPSTNRFETNWPNTLQPLLPPTASEPDDFDLGWVPEESMLSYLSNKKTGLVVERSEDAIFSYELRLGIQIDSSVKATVEGRLFQVQFVRLQTDVGLLVEVDQVRLKDKGMLQLGGEARAAMYRTEKQAQIDVPRQGRLDDQSRPLKFKLYLATPALFKQGWLPQWIRHEDLKGDYKGVPVELAAAAVGRPQPIGGRDIARGDCQRVMYSAVPAGSVYFFQTQTDAATVFDTFDGECISDIDREIGFGLTYLGRW